MIEESGNESNKELDNESIEKINKESEEKSNKELIKTVSPKNDDNTTNW